MDKLDNPDLRQHDGYYIQYDEKGKLTLDDTGLPIVARTQSPLSLKLQLHDKTWQEAKLYDYPDLRPLNEMTTTSEIINNVLHYIDGKLQIEGARAKLVGVSQMRTS